MISSKVVGGNFFCADIMARRCVEALSKLDLIGCRQPVCDATWKSAIGEFFDEL